MCGYKTEKLLINNDVQVPDIKSDIKLWATYSYCRFTDQFFLEDEFDPVPVFPATSALAWFSSLDCLICFAEKSLDMVMTICSACVLHNNVNC